MGFFNKKDRAEDDRSPYPAETAPEQPVEVPSRKNAGPPPATLSVISRNITIQGTVRGDEDLLVDGTIEGEIRLSKALTIGASGVVRADVLGETVTVMGKVNGNVSATVKVILKPTARVVGNITCPSFVVNEGASFEGNINMRAPSDKPETGKTAPSKKEEAPAAAPPETAPEPEKPRKGKE